MYMIKSGLVELSVNRTALDKMKKFNNDGRPKLK